MKHILQDDFTVGELFYCLIQDIEDYLMRNEDEDIYFVLAQLDALKEKYDLQKFDQRHLSVLISNVDYLRQKSKKDEKYLPFYKDIKVILKRVQNEIK